MTAPLSDANFPENLTFDRKAPEPRLDKTNQRFNLQNFKNRLEPVEKKNKYISSEQIGHDLGIEPEKSFDECYLPDIREGVSSP